MRQIDRKFFKKSCNQPHSFFELASEIKNSLVPYENYLNIYCFNLFFPSIFEQFSNLGSCIPSDFLTSDNSCFPIFEKLQLFVRNKCKVLV